MKDIFDKFPFLEILADPIEPEYRVRYTECVQDRGVVRFERREARLSMSDLALIVEDIVRRAKAHGR